MTPKQLLEAHGGDPLAAADLLMFGLPLGSTPTLRGLFDAHCAGYSTAFAIGAIGEDGAEKWGQALMAVLKLDPFGDMWCEIRELRHEEITRIANATDRERLAACIVTLAEVE